LVGAMVPWIGMMGSTSTPGRSPPLSSAKSQDLPASPAQRVAFAGFVAHPAFTVCATPGFHRHLLRTRPLQGCATADPIG
jgi:xanthine/CO dehydrogenase XdhC/CoxF family maturation factor